MSSTLTLSLTRDVETPEGGWSEVEVVVKVNYLPGDPGKLSGPPERCYPPEPAELEVESSTIDGEEVELTEAEVEALYEKAEEALADAEEPDYPEPDYDDDRADFMYDPFRGR